MDDKMFDEQYEKAKRAAAAAHAVEPRARHAHYDRESGLVVVRLQNEESFSFSPLAVEELAQGSTDELTQVEVSPSGDGLHWQRLDADIGVIALQQIALEQLYARIETAWLQQQDHQLADQLADQYPQFKDELYDFFTLLVDSELDEPLPSGVAAQSIEQTKQWLESEGFAQAKGAAQTAKQKSGSTSNHPATPVEKLAANESDEDADDDLMRLLTDHTGLAEEKIASDNDIPDVVMVYVEDHYDLTPIPVREEIIDRFARSYSLDKTRLRRAASRGSRAEAKVAALRKSPYPPGVSSFIDRIERSNLPKKVKEYWLDLAKKGNLDEKT
ncbi:MAG: DUF2442 domain-containing protein [Acidobacteriota bacterium]